VSREASNVKTRDIRVLFIRSVFFKRRRSIPAIIGP